MAARRKKKASPGCEAWAIVNAKERVIGCYNEVFDAIESAERRTKRNRRAVHIEFRPEPEGYEQFFCERGKCWND